MSFSETVNASSFDASKITVQDSQTASVVVQLTGGKLLSTDGTTLTLLLTKLDLNSLKKFTNLSVSNQTSYIVVTEDLVRDMNSNPVITIVDGSAQRVRQFTEDLIPPRLLSFDLDMNAATLTLVFTETINTSSIQVDEIFIRPSVLSPDFLSHRLQIHSSRSSSPDWFGITINLGDDDMNTLKKLVHLAIDNSSTFISLSNKSVSDMNANSVDLVSADHAVRVTHFTPDTTNPLLVSFDLDVNFGNLTLLFTETVNVSTLHFTFITLQNTQDVSQSTEVVKLTGGQQVTLDNDLMIQFNLSTDDLNLLKKLTDLGTSDNNTFVSVLEGTVLDMNRNNLTAIVGSLGRQVRSLVNDTTPPQLVDFDVNLNSGQLIFTFSETAETDSLNVSALTLQSERIVSNTSEWLTLSGGLQSVDDSTVITLDLSVNDRSKYFEKTA